MAAFLFIFSSKTWSNLTWLQHPTEQTFFHGHLLSQWGLGGLLGRMMGFIQKIRPDVFRWHRGWLVPSNSSWTFGWNFSPCNKNWPRPRIMFCFFNSPSQSPSWVAKNPLSHWGSVNRCRQGWCIFLRNEELNHPWILKITGIGKVLGDNELPPSTSQLQKTQGLLGTSHRKGHLWVVSAASGGTNWGWAVEVQSHCKVGHFWASKNWKKAYK